MNNSRVEEKTLKWQETKCREECHHHHAAPERGEAVINPVL